MKKQSNSDAVYGIRPVIEAIRSGKVIDRILIKKGLSGELYGELVSVLRENGIHPQHVSAERFAAFGSRNHQGVVAYISPVDFQPVEEVVAQLWELGKNPFLIVLDGVTDVRNFGAIVRTAECAGAHAVIIPNRGTAKIGSDAVKTSAGALHHMPICKVNSLKSTISFLKLSGIKVVAATEKSSKNYTQADIKPPVAIIMGSEDVGVSPEILKQADELVSIPIVGKVDSLNVSVAAGILMYEATRTS
ncbi:MAG TPA: 23S rRNA (guanosine(2251)-2'-O)-methyltransferase RlmB [Tenuifilaceae bacterium]|nr:23S rRNA (guanosine(2251)-2'-O)-methyltransferase RlmB [Tenuifilaceae bacterium]HPE18202.1 23S rRNA (guanosine(2251)-2'-O)-methyltransferase RlmB [Tenuifilaceae bacterium]HPJ45485.1 23S rRNA (guanosine(2251)-2'-O)-methyltransferase RlmB [Tenuifilaceae bacterium]HPQ33892.1 23S rRNA (guanosine(2251)-2'-O)-methyltransferase RlmB [Tenuifilaceae bacterium]HRX68245.1 23S rRNA (guanosine(2251)-2'-O)-methyltransferase RlmB [Tenuifilaceae bacterium]